MSFFSDIFEDVVEVTDKVVRLPVRVMWCGSDSEHDWEHVKGNRYQCRACSKTKGQIR